VCIQHHNDIIIFVSYWPSIVLVDSRAGRFGHLPPLGGPPLSRQWGRGRGQGVLRSQSPPTSYAHLIISLVTAGHKTHGGLPHLSVLLYPHHFRAGEEAGAGEDPQAGRNGEGQEEDLAGVLEGKSRGKIIYKQLGLSLSLVVAKSPCLGV